MNTVSANTIGLCLEPLDVLFFRDGRPFLSGTENMVSGLPLPQTLAGALRTALLRSAGCDFKRLRQALETGQPLAQAVPAVCPPAYHWIGQLAVRGPWLARWIDARKQTYEVLVPMPAIVHRAKPAGACHAPALSQKETEAKRQPAQCFRLAPLPEGRLPGWDPPADQRGLRPLWLKHLGPTEPAQGYLTRDGLEQFLRGGIPQGDAVVCSGDLFGLDHRTGIGITPDRLAAEKSQIFGRGFLVLNPGVFLYAEISLPEASALDGIDILALGGEGRRVAVRRLDEPFAWPEAFPSDGEKPLLLLTTPCVFEAGWRPRALANCLVAAAVPAPLAFSGWDLARGGPKPTRFAAAAGTVFFLDSLPPDWQSTVAETDEDRQLGWGCCLAGVWNDE